MPVTEYETSLEARVAFKRLTGLTIRLTPFEVMTAIDVQSPTQIVVKVTTFQVRERKSDVQLTARGTRLLGFGSNSTTLGWAQIGKAVTIWDTDFTPFSYNLYGSGKTFADWIADRSFARLCFRPGTAQFPLDNHERTLAGYSTSKMERYW